MEKELNSMSEGYKRIVQENKGAYWINLPMKFVKAHGLVKGSRVRIFEENGRILLKAVRQPLQKNQTHRQQTPLQGDAE